MILRLTRSARTLRAVFALLRTQVSRKAAGVHECERATQSACARGIFNRVTKDLRPPKVMNTQVGRTPWSARVPLDPLFRLRLFSHQADEVSAADHGVRPLIFNRASPRTP
jgi:hypothetical protein